MPEALGYALFHRPNDLTVSPARAPLPRDGRCADTYGRLARVPATPGSAGYSSPVCSIQGDAIDQIAAAIDQLARDLQADSGVLRTVDYTARVADIWLMVTALDPDLARLVRRYLAPAGPGDSADT